MCGVPRTRYSLLGHRAALVLTNDAEAGDTFASFLKSTQREEVRRRRRGQPAAVLRSRRPGCLTAAACSLHCNLPADPTHLSDPPPAAPC